MPLNVYTQGDPVGHMQLVIHRAVGRAHELLNKVHPVSDLLDPRQAS